MKEILKQLCAANGVPGYEDEVRECIRNLVEPYADEIIEDHLGNLLVLKKGAKPRKEKSPRALFFCPRLRPFSAAGFRWGENVL